MKQTPRFAFSRIFGLRPFMHDVYEGEGPGRASLTSTEVVLGLEILHRQALLAFTSAIHPIGTSFQAFSMHGEAYTHTATSLPARLRDCLHFLRLYIQ